MGLVYSLEQLEGCNSGHILQTEGRLSTSELWCICIKDIFLALLVLKIDQSFSNWIFLCLNSLLMNGIKHILLILARLSVQLHLFVLQVLLHILFLASLSRFKPKLWATLLWKEILYLFIFLFILWKWMLLFFNAILKLLMCNSWLFRALQQLSPTLF